MQFRQVDCCGVHEHCMRLVNCHRVRKVCKESEWAGSRENFPYFGLRENSKQYHSHKYNGDPLGDGEGMTLEQISLKTWNLQLLL